MKRETERKLDELMAGYFPHIGDKFNDLKQQQQNYIAEILNGKDVMVVMPTAGGKSICFQLPALYWEDSITIVVSPLRALIREQVEELNRREKVAVVIGSHSTIDLIYGGESAEEERYNDIINKVYRLVYVTPEMLVNNQFLRVVRRIRKDVKMVAVDEAHCVSTWGYSFRPAYLDIRRFVRTFPKRPVLSAYTATATRFIMRDTVRALGMRPEKLEESLKYDRPDLIFHVKHIYTSEENSARNIKEHEVLKIVRQNVKKGNQGIIFCATPGEVNSIYGYLVSKKDELGCGISKYYGEKMSNEERKANLEEFMSGGSSLVMVATNAFGMGINMPGLRFIIHYNIPLCIENYCQEAGRAARGKDVTADCYLLHSRADEKICRLLISKNPYPDRRKLAYDRLEKMVEYTKKDGSAELSNELLHRRINDYFQSAEKENTEESEDAAQRFPLYVNRTYIANEIRKGVYKAGFDGEKELHFRSTESSVRYKLYGENLEDDAELTYFDMMVADAVYSLWINNRPIYAKSIWIILTGDDRITLKREKKEIIEESLRKLQRTSVKIEQRKAGNFGMKLEDEEEIFEGAFLPFEERETETEPYVLQCVPPLYLYAEIQGQFHIFRWEQLRLLQIECGECLRPAVNAKGDPKKIQATVENTILKHYLLRRIDLLSAPGTENKAVHKTEARRKRGVVHAKKRSGVLSDKINYVQADGTDLLEKMGVIRATDYKYTLARRREDMVGTSVPKKDEEGNWQCRVLKKGRIEKILDYYVYMEMLAGYESRIHEEEIRPGREMMFTQIRLDRYTKKDKQKYVIDRKNRGESLQINIDKMK